LNLNLPTDISGGFPPCPRRRFPPRYDAYLALPPREHDRILPIPFPRQVLSKHLYCGKRAPMT